MTYRRKMPLFPRNSILSGSRSVSQHRNYSSSRLGSLTGGASSFWSAKLTERGFSLELETSNARRLNRSVHAPECPNSFCQLLTFGAYWAPSEVLHILCPHRQVLRKHLPKNLWKRHNCGCRDGIDWGRESRTSI